MMDITNILDRARQTGGDRFLCKSALHLSGDGRAVSETDPTGRYVLVGPGGSLPADLAEELGLNRPEVKVEPEPVEEVKPESDEPDEPTAADGKAVEPQQNKMVKPGANKSAK